MSEERDSGMYAPNEAQKELLNKLNLALRRIARDQRQRRIDRTEATRRAVAAVGDLRNGLRMQAAAKLEFERLCNMIERGWIEEAADEMTSTFVGVGAGTMVGETIAERRRKQRERRRRVAGRRRDVTKEPTLPPILQITYDDTISKAVAQDEACIQFIRLARACTGELSPEIQSEFWRRMRERRRERIRANRKARAERFERTAAERAHGAEQLTLFDE